MTIIGQAGIFTNQTKRPNNFCSLFYQRSVSIYTPNLYDVQTFTSQQKVDTKFNASPHFTVQFYRLNTTGTTICPWNVYTTTIFIIARNWLKQRKKNFSCKLSAPTSLSDAFDFQFLNFPHWNFSGAVKFWPFNWTHSTEHLKVLDKLCPC